MRQKLLFLVNPKAGQVEVKNHLMEILDVFTAGGFDATVHTTQHPGELTAFLAQNGSDYDLAVCAGGDGTLNEAVSGLMEMERPIPLGYIPGGTVNDVAHTLNLSRDSVQAARDIVSGKPKAIDVGRFCQKRWFTYVAGFGAFTDVSYETPQADKRALGRLAYLLNGAKSLVGLKPIPVKVTAGDRVIEEDILLGLVCSTTSVGGIQAKKLSDGIRLDDGLFEVMLVKNITSLQDLNGLGALLTKREFDPRFFHTFQTDYIRFEFPQPVKWTLDGEFGGAEDQVEIQNHTCAVQIIVPKK